MRFIIEAIPRVAFVYTRFTITFVHTRFTIGLLLSIIAISYTFGLFEYFKIVRMVWKNKKLYR